MKNIIFFLSLLLLAVTSSCKSSIGGQVEQTTFTPEGPIDTVLHTYNGVLSCPTLQWEFQGNREIGAYMENPSWAVVIVNVNQDFEPVPVYTKHPANYLVSKSYQCNCYFNGAEATVYVDSSSLRPLKSRLTDPQGPKAWTSQKNVP